MYTNQKGQRLAYDQNCHKGLTKIGKKALEYLRNPESFPADCPNPNVDAKAFADYCRKMGWA